jgi:hypothetical protein
MLMDPSATDIQDELNTNLSEQLAWIISFIGSAIATAQKDSRFPNYSWFTVAFMLCCIVGVFVVVASDTTQTYHVAIVGYLACGLVLTSSSVNSLIYTADSAKEATAAGHILLSMVNVCIHCPESIHILTSNLDCLDLLLWINTICRSSRIP